MAEPARCVRVAAGYVARSVAEDIVQDIAVTLLARRRELYSTALSVYFRRATVSADRIRAWSGSRAILLFVGGTEDLDRTRRGSAGVGDGRGR